MLTMMRTMTNNDDNTNNTSAPLAEEESDCSMSMCSEEEESEDRIAFDCFQVGWRDQSHYRSLAFAEYYAQSPFQSMTSLLRHSVEMK